MNISTQRLFGFALLAFGFFISALLFLDETGKYDYVPSLKIILVVIFFSLVLFLLLPRKRQKLTHQKLILLNLRIDRSGGVLTIGITFFLAVFVFNFVVGHPVAEFLLRHVG